MNIYLYVTSCHILLSGCSVLLSEWSTSMSCFAVPPLISAFYGTPSCLIWSSYQFYGCPGYCPTSSIHQMVAVVIASYDTATVSQMMATQDPVIGAENKWSNSGISSLPFWCWNKTIRVQLGQYHVCWWHGSFMVLIMQENWSLSSI